MPKAAGTSAQKKHEIRDEAIDRVTILITSALGLVAALAWNSAIQKLFSVAFGTQSSLEAMFAYAVVVTVLAVIIIIYFTRVTAKLKSK
ncbi:MAG: DUF5654 family protein [Candidatus Marsarchaeota archaeon]|nr:DUF5654 family protein [Candidatus Marsarchaeota archaeon]